MSGQLNSKAFEEREMQRHYEEGFCEDRSMCHFCRILQQEKDYFAEIDEEMAKEYYSEEQGD